MIVVRLMPTTINLFIKEEFMAKIVDVKSCERCNKELFKVDVATRYCSECKKDVRKETIYKYDHKNRDYDRLKYIENFMLVYDKDNLKTVTPNGFNEVSDIHSRTYLIFFNMKWIEILDMFMLKDRLTEYYVDAYTEHIKSSNSVGMKEFFNNHKYTNYNMARQIGVRKIREFSKDKPTRYTEDDLIQNFKYIMSEYQVFPTYQMFIDKTKISYIVYQKRYAKGSSKYDTIIENMFDGKYSSELLSSKKTLKERIGKQNAISIPEDDLINEIHRICDKCKREFDSLPNHAMFEKLAKHSLETYKRCFNKTVREIMYDLGYDVESQTNSAEKIVLHIIKTELNE
ncbi:MAG: hypothetical protein WD512_09000, partial [Candidatus Paceibacterota bacterium]